MTSKDTAPTPSTTSSGALSTTAHSKTGMVIANNPLMGGIRVINPKPNEKKRKSRNEYGVGGSSRKLEESSKGLGEGLGKSTTASAEMHTGNHVFTCREIH